MTAPVREDALTGYTMRATLDDPHLAAVFARNARAAAVVEPSSSAVHTAERVAATGKPD
jgi:hypothetical protein